MKLFFSLFEKKGDEEGEKKRRCDRRKRVAGALIILMLFVTVYAEPASAFSFSSWWDGVKERTKDTLKIGAAVIIGVVVGGGCLASTFGFGSAACIGMGLAAAGATYAAIELAIGDDDEETQTIATFTADRYADAEDVVNDDDQTSELLDDANQEAYQRIAELTAKLRSDLTRYDTKEDGATGDLWIEIYAPQSIYGFSAFPVQVKLYTKKSNIPFNVIHLRSVEIYLQKENSTVPLWKRVWDYSTGSQGLNGESIVYSTILKVPDDYVYTIQNAIQTGQVTRELIEQLFNATTSSWEIFVKVDAYREIWQSDPNYTTQSDCEAAGGKWDSTENICYVFEKNVDIDYTAYTTSAWRHVSMAHDIAQLADGFYASLPVKFLNTEAATKWVIYQSKYTGAISNFIILTFATPLHVIGSTADYKFYIVPNPGYFDPLSPTFTDDFRFVVVREYKDLSWTVADSILGDLGTMASDTPVLKLLTAHYTEDPETLTYKVYGLVSFSITRDDNITIPLWLVVSPKISVIPNTRTVLADEQMEQLVQFTDDGKLTEEEIEQIKGIAASLIDGLQEKIAAAEELKKKADAENNEKASLYAEKAIQAYEDAIDALNKITQTDAVQEYLNWLNVAKKLEQAGDFYMSAAEKALYGEYEQAELDAQKGDELSQLADEYKPGFNLSSLLGGDNMIAFITILIIALFLAGIAYVVLGNQRLAVIIFIVTFLGLLLLVFGFLDSANLPELKLPT